jgi:hypothetical protein
MANNLKTLIEGFGEADYGRVTRNESAYAETTELTVNEINRLVVMYKAGGGMQHLRLLRDSIDHWIRRYHGYTIGGGIGSHYIQVGVNSRDCIFEHIIPASKIRDMMLAGVLTVPQALNAPTCLISKTNDDVLRQAGHVSTSPSYWHFFDRYNVLTGNTFSVYNGATIADTHGWTLDKHYKHFGV